MRHSEPNKFNLQYESDGVNSYRYLYILNFTDQTVSVFDTNSHTVVATITLSSGKNITAVHYVPKNHSVYALASAWYDRIDANPASGTFNTVVQSGAFTNNSNVPVTNYNPVVDAFMSTFGELFFIGSDNSVNMASSNNKWPVIFRPTLINEGRNFSITNLNVSPSNVVPFGTTGLFLVPGSNNGTMFAIYKLVNYRGTLSWIDVSFGESKNRVGYPCKVGNFIFSGRTNVGSYDVIDLETGLTLTTFSLSPTDRVSAKYVPVGGVGGRIFVYQKINTNTNISVVDWATKTDMGDISRSGYKATDENCTKQAIYCPYDKCFYVMGGNTAGTGTVNKLHRYDPTQVLASMYVNSYTIGNSATDSAHYLERVMCMNGIERYDYNDPMK